jgi:predicted transcriptional regulator
MEWTGKDIETLLKDTGITKTKLAKILKISPPLISQWVRKPDKRIAGHYWKHMDKVAAELPPIKKEISEVADAFFGKVEIPTPMVEDKTDSMCRRIHKIFAMLAEILNEEDLNRLRMFDPADEEIWEIANEVYLQDYKNQVEELNALNSKVIQMENAIGAALDRGGARIVEKLHPST